MNKGTIKKLMDRGFGFINTLTQSGLEKSIAFIKTHPEVQPLVEKWMVLSTRNELKSNKDGETK